MRRAPLYRNILSIFRKHADSLFCSFIYSRLGRYVTQYYRIVSKLILRPPPLLYTGIGEISEGGGQIYMTDQKKKKKSINSSIPFYKLYYFSGWG